MLTDLHILWLFDVEMCTLYVRFIPSNKREDFPEDSECQLNELQKKMEISLVLEGFVYTMIPKISSIVMAM